MSTPTRFLYDNFADTERGAVIYTGAAPPVGYALLTAMTGFVLSNVLNDSRGTVVKITGTNGLIDIDLGQARDVEAIGLMNVYLDSGSSYPVIRLYSSPDNVTWEDHGEMFDAASWVGVKDRYVKLPAVYPRRYWRLHVTTGTAWYLGNVFLCAYHEFPHGIFSPDSDYVKTPPQTRVGDLAPVVWVLGPARERFRNLYETIEEDTAAVFTSISAAAKPFGYVHHDGALRHVLAGPDGIKLIAVSQDDGMVFDTVVEMEQLV